MTDNTMYGYTRAEHEYLARVPAMMTGDSDIVIGISAHGGGTVGEEYAGNGWDYAVYIDGHGALITGQDLRSPAGRPAGHAEMTRALCDFLNAAGESFSYRGEESDYAAEYPRNDVREFLIAEHERFALAGLGGWSAESPVPITE